MNVCILSESPADDVGIRNLIDGILKASSPVPVPIRARAGGWPSVFGILPTVIRSLHFRAEADALVVVVDSNGTVVHRADHEDPGPPDPICRLCRLNGVVAQTRKELTSVPGRNRLKIAVGVAVPAIEAWYLCGRDRRVGEDVWRSGLLSGATPYSTAELKKAVYGTSRPSLAMETEHAAAESLRVAQSIADLERLFPNGFGSLAREIRGWR